MLAVQEKVSTKKAVISLRNIKKSYQLGENRVSVLHNICLDIEEGDMVALLGTSGSGKSTLMNILGCLDVADSGEYILDNKQVSSLSAKELSFLRSRKIGFIFQSFNLLPRMTALENVALPLLYAGHRNSNELALKALETVGLGDRAHHEPNQLSGGQRQRVAVARAIVSNPAKLLADEPTGKLDSKTTEEIMGLFHELNKQGRTIIIVTHEKEIADECRRQIHMKDGCIVEEGEKYAILDNS